MAGWQVRAEQDRVAAESKLVTSLSDSREESGIIVYQGRKIRQVPHAQHYSGEVCNVYMAACVTEAKGLSKWPELEDVTAGGIVSVLV